VKAKAARKLWSLIAHNFVWKVLSVAIAVLIWILVASEPELSTFRSVPVEFKDLPDDLDISSSVVESVYLELRGPASDLRNFGDPRRFAVVLDMSRAHAGVQTFSISENNVVLPRGLQLVRALPAQLRFEFEPVESRSVPVEVHFSKNPQPGYEIAGYTVSPPAFRISGPASRVARVRAAVTDPIDLSGVVSAAEFRVHAFVDDSRARFETPPEAVVRVTVRRSNHAAKPPLAR